MRSFEVQHSVLDLVPLAEAVLCMDCERISQQRSGHRCAGCESPNLINLAAVLNRTESTGKSPSRSVNASGWTRGVDTAVRQTTLG